MLRTLPVRSFRCGLAALLTLSLAGIPVLLTQTGVASPVLFRIGRGILHDVALSPDGSLIVVATSLGVELLDSGTLEVVHILRATDEVESARCVAFSPDGTLVAAQVKGVGVAVWNVHSGETIHVLTRSAGAWTWSYPGKTVVFIPGGDLLAALDLRNNILVWSLDTGSMVQVVKTFINEPYSLAASPDGRWLALSSTPWIVVYDTRTWRAVHVFEWAAGMPHRSYNRLPVAFSPDSRFVAASGTEKVRIWDMETGEAVLDLPEGSEVLLFSPDGEFLITERFEMEFWELATGREAFTVPVRIMNVIAAAISADGQWLVTGTEDGWLKLCDIPACQVVKESHPYTSRVHAVAVSPDGALLAAGYWEREARVFTSSGETVHHLGGFGWGVFAVTFSPDGSLLAAASGDSSVKAWEPLTGRLVGQIVGFEEPVWNVLFSADGLYLVAGTSELYVWPVGQWGRPPLAQLEGSEQFFSPVALSPDGTCVVVPRKEGLALMEIGTWEVTSLIRTPFVIGEWAWHPEGRLLALEPAYWVAAGTVVVWDTEAGTEVTRLKPWGSSITAMAFSPSGDILAVGSSDGRLALFRSDSWELIAQYKLHTDGIESIAFFPSGDRLATGSDDGTIAVIQLEGMD